MGFIALMLGIGSIIIDYISVYKYIPVIVCLIIGFILAIAGIILSIINIIRNYEKGGKNGLSIVYIAVSELAIIFTTVMISFWLVNYLSAFKNNELVSLVLELGEQTDSGEKNDEAVLEKDKNTYNDQVNETKKNTLLVEINDSNEEKIKDNNIDSSNNESVKAKDNNIKSNNDEGSYDNDNNDVINNVNNEYNNDYNSNDINDFNDDEYDFGDDENYDEEEY